MDHEPHTAAAGYERALELMRRGRLRAAYEVSNELVQSQPDDPRALWVLGRVVWASQGTPLAVMLLERAAGLAPDIVPLRLDVARVLIEAGLPDAALGHLGVVITAEPEHAEAYARRAQAQFALGDRAAAGSAVDRAVALAGDDPETLFAASTALIELGRFDEARSALDRAAAADPSVRGRHVEMVVLMRSRGREADAERLLDGALAVQPDHPELIFLRTTRSGEPGPEGTPTAYVASLFDRYAETFEERLVGDLGYTLPEIIIERAAELAGAGVGSVLDAGCGSGLCAAGLRRLTSRLVGVDASSGMVERASRLELYDELVVADLNQWLLAAAETFDLVVASDVLLYFGDLDQVMSATAQRLRQGGTFLFSIQVGTGATYELRTFNTFQHGPDYVRETAERHGLRQIAVVEGSWRVERDLPVPMAVVTLQRDG